MSEPSPEVRNGASGGSGRWFTVFLALVCIALAVQVILLARQNRALRVRLDEALTRSAADEPAVGDRFGPLKLVDEEGEPIEISFGRGQPRTLLLVFTTDCTACVNTFPIWRDVVPAVALPNLRVVSVAIGTADTAATALPADFPFPTYCAEDRVAAGLERVVRVPTTALLNEQGIAERVWTGYLTQEKEAELRVVIDALTGRDGPGED